MQRVCGCLRYQTAAQWSNFGFAAPVSIFDFSICSFWNHLLICTVFLHLRSDSQPRKRGRCDSPTPSPKASTSSLAPVARTSSPLPVASTSSLPSTKHRHKRICDINIVGGLTVKDLHPNVQKLYAEAREHIKSHVITEDPYASVSSRFDVAKTGYTIIARQALPAVVPEPDMTSGM